MTLISLILHMLNRQPPPRPACPGWSARWIQVGDVRWWLLMGPTGGGFVNPQRRRSWLQQQYLRSPS